MELPDGTREATPQGVPQGGPLSPLLANIDSVSSSGDLALRASCGSPCPRPPGAPIALDPLDKELEARGHRFARYADELPRGWRRFWGALPTRFARLIVMVKSAKAAERVLASLVRFCEGRLQLVVNRAKSRAAPLKACEFLGYRLNNRAKLAWTEKARRRFKERVREWERSGHRLPAGQPRRGERSESNHTPQPRASGEGRHRRTEPVCPRMAQLLQAQLHLQ